MTLVKMEELVRLTLVRRGYTWKPKRAGGSLCGVVSLGRHSATLVVTGLEARTNKTKKLTIDLVAAKIKLAERTIANAEDLERRQLHELELVAQGWKPPAKWKHPFKDAVP